MNKSIINICKINSKLRRRCPQVSFSEKIEVVVLGKSHPNSNVKLSLMNQQRSFDILLDYESVVFYSGWMRIALLFRWTCLLLLLFDFFLLRFRWLFFLFRDWARQVFNFVRILLLQWLLLPAWAVLFDQLVQGFQIIEHVNSSPSIKMGWLQQPQVITIEMAQRHRVPCRCSLLKVKSFKLCYPACVCCIFKTTPSNWVKTLNLIFELLSRRPLIFCCFFLLQLLFQMHLPNQLIFEFLQLFFVCLKCVINLKELSHCLVIYVLFVGVGELDVEGDWHEFERVFFVGITKLLHHV